MTDAMVYRLLLACDAMEAAGVTERHIRTVFSAAEQISIDRAHASDRDGRLARHVNDVFQGAVSATSRALALPCRRAGQGDLLDSPAQLALVDWLREVRGGTQYFV